MRGIVLAYNVTNGPTSDELVSLLRSAEEGLRQQLTMETLTEHPRIKAWRDAFRLFGAKPSEFRSSIEAMTRRALRSDQLPAINTLVDIGNVVSLRSIVPVGGHSIDTLEDDIWLRPARGTETFTAFGSDVEEHPNPGEIIFAEGDTVLCRRWVWRQGNRTLTLPETRNIEFNIDALPPVSVEETENICKSVVELVQKFCGGQARYEILSAEHPSLCLWE